MVEDRSLEALGLAGVPLLEPLLYPGRIPVEPSLLWGRELLPLDVVASERLGRWRVRLQGDDAPPELDALLEESSLTPAGRRYPVLSVGSNASPGQMCHKLERLHLSSVVPMVPVRVRDVAVGVSAHISPAGYVSASPYSAPGTESTLVATWLDEDQMIAVDATETPYHRVLLPGEDFPMFMPSGERLGGAYLYVHRRGVLADPQGVPLRAADQRPLLEGLLARSSRLRELFGPDPDTFVGRGARDEELREAGTEVLEGKGWLLPQPAFDAYVGETPLTLRYDDLSPLETVAR
jgi:hypothetical protein